MNILKKLYTAVVGHATNVGNDIVDSQGLVILEQEIRKAKGAVAEATGSLAGVKADYKKAIREVTKLEDGIKKYTDNARSALQQENEALATDCAERVATLQGQLAQQESLRDRYKLTVDKILAQIGKANKTIKELEFRHKTAVARDRSQKAHEKLSSANLGTNSDVGSALESLDRIERNQEAKDLLMESAEELDAELSGDSLDEKLAASGNTQGSSTASSILDSLREEKK